jgi:hypothetical protein
VIVGLSYIVVVLLAVVVAAIRSGDFFNAKLIGYTYIDLAVPYQSGAEGSLLAGYYLACGVGALILALGLLRNKIIGDSN